MVEASLIDGKAHALGLRQRVGKGVAELVAARKLKPGLATVLVGDDEASQAYVKSKGRVAADSAVVIGRSNLVGRPVAQLLLRADCTVTIAHSRTRDLPGLCRTADIAVVAIGKPEFVRGDWIKPGAAVIDVGINRVAAGDGRTRLVGDVAFAEALPVAGYLTTVPGGVGPMTVACLVVNTLQEARRPTGLPFA